MRKTLVGTTALIAASLAMSGAANAQDEGIQLGVGGYMNNFFAFGDNSSDTRIDDNETGHFSDGEIHFTGEYTLDNGITVGANVQLESFSSGDQIDENYAYVEGSFGRVQLGSENTAAYLMQYAAPNVGTPVNSGWVTSFIAPDANYSAAQFRRPGGSTFGDFGNDENTVTYFTPRFAGFQVGASYQPTLTGTGEGANFPTNRQGAVGNDGASIGANYVNSFNGFDIALAAGYRTIIDENPAVFGDSPEMYSAGINLGYGGFTIGGSWLGEDSEGPGGAPTGNDGNAFDVGVSYSTGPWSVGTMAFYSETENPGFNGDDEYQAYQVGLAYTLGTGVEASVSGLYAKYEGGTGNVGTETDGLQVISGLALSF